MEDKFRDMGAGRKKPAPKEVKTSLGVIDFVPTFNEDDVVVLGTDKAKYSTNYAKLVGKDLKVKCCKVSDLGDMVIEVLYLQDAPYVANPYLVEHFELK